MLGSVGLVVRVKEGLVDFAHARLDISELAPVNAGVTEVEGDIIAQVFFPELIAFERENGLGIPEKNRFATHEGLPGGLVVF